MSCLKQRLDNGHKPSLLKYSVICDYISIADVYGLCQVAKTNLSLPVNVAVIADIDYYNEKPLSEDLIDDAVAPHPVGIKTFQHVLEGFPLTGISFQGIKDIGQTPVQSGVPFRDSLQDGFSLVSDLELIASQGTF